MTTCYACGGVTDPQRTSRGPLAVSIEPPGATWRGLPLQLTERQTRLLHLLVTRGRVSHLAIQMLASGEDASPDAAKVVIHLLRRRLPRECQIRNIYGWGYELTIEETSMNENTTAPPEPVDDVRPTTLKQLALAAAGNIGATDQVGVLVVIQADGAARVTPMKASASYTVQALGLATSVIGRTINAKVAARNDRSAA